MNLSLNACHNCGYSKVHIIPIVRKKYAKIQAVVECPKCGTRSEPEMINELRTNELGKLTSIMTEKTIAEGKQRLIKKWNRRVTNETIHIPG